MTVIDLVPPLDLCKLIPDGAFEDSAMVWWDSNLYLRRDVSFTSSTPAPTVQEIMAKMDSDGLYYPILRYQVEKWVVDCDTGDIDADGYMPEIHRDEDENPASAALRLWIKLKGDKRA